MNAEGTFWGAGPAFSDMSLLMRYIDWCCVTFLSVMAGMVMSVIITFFIWLIGWIIIGLAEVIVKASEEKPNSTC
jgi:hypothetical protein